MPRKPQGKRMVRAELETVTLELVDVEEVLPDLRLRITQAIKRAGLTSLLDPALADVDRMTADVAAVKAQIAVTIAKLMQ